MTRASIRLRTATVATAVVVGPAAVLAGSDLAGAASAEPGRDAGKNLVLRPGAVGKAEVGMTIDEAMKTGLFRRSGLCGPLQPKGKLNRQLGSFTRRGHLVGMKVTGRNIRTAKGAGIGTSLRELRSMYGDRLVKPRRIKHNPERLWGTYIRSGERYLGFLLGTRPQAHPKPTHKVTYLEVTRGKRPTLYPDGC